MDDASLILQLRDQLIHAAGLLPVETVLGAVGVTDEIEAVLTPELGDSDNDHAHRAHEMLCLLIDELNATHRELTATHENITTYADTR